MICKSSLFLLLTSLLTFGAQAAEIEADRLSAIVKVLASDEFEGRAPGGAGEAKTVAYLVEQFTALGLEPGGSDGGWTQAVPLVHTQLQTPVKLELAIGDAHQPLVQGQDVEVST
ncbi:MAG: peptidase M20, partial [Xanthomonadales bacterium]|nr:peptidase M20 [Xanthomonadales bacterium]